MPLSSVPAAASASALQHKRITHGFAHAACASRPVRLLPAAFAICCGHFASRARGILFRATAQRSAARAFHLRSHITATGKACSGDRATSSWAAAAATQSVTPDHHARTAATHWHPRPPTPLGSPCPAAAACPSQDGAETEAAEAKVGGASAAMLKAEAAGAAELKAEVAETAERGGGAGFAMGLSVRV